VRALIVEAIPTSLRLAVAVGIGLFLSLIGLKNGGFVIGNSATLVGFGGMNATTGLFVFGLILTGWLIVRETKGALIIGIASVSIIALIVSKLGIHFGWLDSAIVSPPEKIFDRPSFDVFLKLDLKGALTMGMIFPIFSLLFVDMFDSISTLLGVSQVAGLVDEKGHPKNMQRALLVDSFATAVAGLTGSSSGTTYIESASGVKEGGRTGLTAIVVGLLFLPFMFLSPLLKFIPPVATAPVLFLIGIFMASPMGKIKWFDYEESIPAFLAIILIPLTYSITQGIIWGFLVYTAIKILRGKWGEIHWMLYVIDAFAILSIFSEQIEGLIFK
jgi:AGZA family xanthine/uracil permease-like MFS transporter